MTDSQPSLPYHVARGFFLIAWDALTTLFVLVTYPLRRMTDLQPGMPPNPTYINPQWYELCKSLGVSYHNVKVYFHGERQCPSCWGRQIRYQGSSTVLVEACTTCNAIGKVRCA